MIDSLATILTTRECLTVNQFVHSNSQLANRVANRKDERMILICLLFQCHYSHLWCCVQYQYNVYGFKSQALCHSVIYMENPQILLIFKHKSFDIKASIIFHQPKLFVRKCIVYAFGLFIERNSIFETPFEFYAQLDRRAIQYLPN